MKVKELIKLLKDCRPDDVVLVRVDGSIFPTDNVDEHEDYNFDRGPGEFFILTTE